MVASARIVVLMTPDEKAALQAKAARAGAISAAELVRRAVNAYDEADRNEAEILPADRSEAAELETLLALFKATRAATLEQLDRTDRALDRALAPFPEARLPA